MSKLFEICDISSNPIFTRKQSKKKGFMALYLRPPPTLDDINVLGTKISLKTSKGWDRPQISRNFSILFFNMNDIEQFGSFIV